VPDDKITTELIAAYEMVLRHQEATRDEAQLLATRTSDLIRSLQAKLEIVREASGAS
jgi:hypothetical protein